MQKKLIHTPEGVRDIYGNEFRKKLETQNRLMEVLRSFGYEDIQTPVFEFFDNYTNSLIRREIPWLCGLISHHLSQGQRQNTSQTKICH